MSLKDLVLNFSVRTKDAQKNMAGLQSQLRNLANSEATKLNAALGRVSQGGGTITNAMTSQIRQVMKLQKLADGMGRPEATDKASPTWINKQFSTLKTHMQKAIAGLALTAAAGGFAVGGIMAKAIVDGLEAKRIDLTLQQAVAGSLKSINIDTPIVNGLTDALKGQAEMLQIQLRVDDDEIKSAQVELLNMGMTAREAMANMARVADVAAAKNISMAEAAKIVGLAYNGNIRALRGVGIVLQSTGNKARDAANAQLALDQRFGGFAKRAIGLQSPFQAVSLLVGKISEDVGGRLLVSMQPIADKISAIMAYLTQSEGYEAFLTWVESAGQSIMAHMKSGWQFLSIGWGVIKEWPTILTKTLSGGLATSVGAALLALSEIAKALIKALLQFILASWPAAITGMIALIIAQVAGTLKSLLGEKLSKWLDLDSITEAAGKVAATAGADVAKNAQAGFSTFGSKAAEAGSQFAQTAGRATGIQQAWNKASDDVLANDPMHQAITRGQTIIDQSNAYQATNRAVTVSPEAIRATAQRNQQMANQFTQQTEAMNTPYLRQTITVQSSESLTAYGD